jgi:hypothetical protein
MKKEEHPFLAGNTNGSPSPQPLSPYWFFALLNRQGRLGKRKCADCAPQDIDFANILMWIIFPYGIAIPLSSS